MPPGAAKAFKTKRFDGPRGYGKAYCMFPPILVEELRSHLERLFADEPGSADAMLLFLKPLVVRYCRRRAATLPADLHEDVVQQTLLILVGSGRGKYRSADGTSAGYLFNAVRTALQCVRRRSGMTAGRHCSSTESLDVEDLAIDSHAEEKQVNAIMAHQILSSVEPTFARVLWRVYAEGKAQETVLAHAGMSRFAFDRRRKAVARSFSHLKRCA